MSNVDDASDERMEMKQTLAEYKQEVDDLRAQLRKLQAHVGYAEVSDDTQDGEKKQPKSTLA